MPIIDMPVDMLLARMAQADTRAEATRRRGDEATKGTRLTVDELLELLPRLGCEVEELADVQQYVCRTCGKIYDRTEAQGAPLNCSSLPRLRSRPIQQPSCGL